MVSLEDASRGLTMFQTLDVPILGVVENMRGEFFGSGGGEELAKKAGVPFLGAVPMESTVRVCGDAGTPLVASRPDSQAAKALRAIAEQVAARVSVEAVNAQQSPTIKVV
jgi:ATP-binding protein involved in chromosome partitioning